MKSAWHGDAEVKKGQTEVNGVWLADWSCKLPAASIEANLASCLDNVFGVRTYQGVAWR